MRPLTRYLISPGCAVHSRLKGPSGSSRQPGDLHFDLIDQPLVGLRMVVANLLVTSGSSFILVGFLNLQDVPRSSWSILVPAFLVRSKPWGIAARTGSALARQGASPASAASKITSRRGSGSAACTGGHGPRAAAVAGEAGTEEAAVLSAVHSAALFRVKVAVNRVEDCRSPILCEQMTRQTWPLLLSLNMSKHVSAYL